MQASFFRRAPACGAAPWQSSQPATWQPVQDWAKKLSPSAPKARPANRFSAARVAIGPDSTPPAEGWQARHATEAGGSGARPSSAAARGPG